VRTEGGGGVRITRKSAAQSDNGAVYREELTNIRRLQWRHLITGRTDEGSPLSQPTSGFTTWIAPIGRDRIAAISWEWVVIDPGVITVGNLLRIASNLYPTDASGLALDPSSRSQVLVQIVSGLDWYDVVRHHANDTSMR